MFGNVNRDPRMRVISVAYRALTSNKNIKITCAGDDAKRAIWFDVKVNYESDTKQIELYNKEESIDIKFTCLENENPFLSDSKDTLAFDYMHIINKALERLQNKLEYTDIVFSLLPEKFTFYQLQQVYELLLQQTLIKPNFRRDIKYKLIELDEKQ